MFITKVNQTYPKLILRLSFPPSTDGMSKTSFYSDSELLSVVTDLLVSVLLMTTNNTWSSMSQTSDWENWPFYQREIQRERVRNNSKEKSKNQEVLKREKSLPLEKSKLKVMSEEPRKNILKNLSLEQSDVYSLLTFYNL